MRATPLFAPGAPAWIWQASGPAVLLAPALLAVAIAWPALRFPWSLIDEGWTQLAARTMDAGIRSGRLVSVGHDPEGLISLGINGRGIRPAALLYKWMQYRLFGDNPVGFHVVKTLEFALTAMLLAAVTAEVTRRWSAGLVAGILWALNAPSTEHWLRLYTQEPQVILACGASLWLMMRAERAGSASRVGRACVAAAALLLIPGYFLKETGVFMLPTSGTLWLLSRRRLLGGEAAWQRATTIYAGLNLGLTVGLLALIRLVHPLAPTYSTLYDPANLGRLLANGRLYATYVLLPFAPLLPLVGLGAIAWRRWRRSGLAVARDRLRWTLVWAAWPAAWLLTYVPWPSSQSYYMLGATFGVCLLGGCLASAGLWSFAGAGRTLAAGVVAISVVGYILLNAPWQQRFIAGFYERGLTDARLVRFLAETTPPKSQVWFNLDPQRTEWGAEVDIHLALFYQRDDVQVRFLGEPPGPQAGDFVVIGLRDARYPPETLLNAFEITPAMQTRIGQGALAWWLVEVAPGAGEASIGG